jgi:hypothetical protein
MKSLNRFTTGPFLSASHNIEDIACGLYFSYLLQQTVKEHNQLEALLEKAKKDNDDELIQKFETELCYIEGAYQLSLFVDGDKPH